eukprot:s1948_g15.t1
MQPCKLTSYRRHSSTKKEILETGRHSKVPAVGLEAGGPQRVEKPGGADLRKSPEDAPAVSLCTTPLFPEGTSSEGGSPGLVHLKAGFRQQHLLKTCSAEGLLHSWQLGSELIFRCYEPTHFWKLLGFSTNPMSSDESVQHAVEILNGLSPEQLIQVADGLSAAALLGLIPRGQMRLNAFQVLGPGLFPMAGHHQMPRFFSGSRLDLPPAPAAAAMGQADAEPTMVEQTVEKEPGGELMVFDDGSMTADKAQSSAMSGAVVLRLVAGTDVGQRTVLPGTAMERVNRLAAHVTPGLAPQPVSSGILEVMRTKIAVLAKDFQGWLP